MDKVIKGVVHFKKQQLLLII